ncbi:MAG: hypothetical protein QM723_32675 [Myxococcaceae bacterium]
MRSAVALALLALAACSGAKPQTDGGTKVHAKVSITASAVSTRIEVREDLLASGEMQISGEPLAEAMGRDLGDYSRDHLPADLYFDTTPLSPGAWIDLPGYSTGIESYEYSKQAMNTIAFESGAGTSLVHAALIETTSDGGLAALSERVHHYAEASNGLGRFIFDGGTFPTNNLRGGDFNPLGAGLPENNPLGWPGIWPTNHVFKSFDPTIDPSHAVGLWCAISSDDDPGATGAASCPDYECDATTLHLRDRAAQSDFTVTPGADGFSAWKYALWSINYLQVMHDSTEAGVSSVDEADLALVGTANNTVVGADDTGAETAPGTWAGSSDIEGFQAAMFLTELDARADDWLLRLSTDDGQSLGGFTSLAEALKYDGNAPLRWFPSKVAVTETADPSGFPRPAYALASADSDLLDQLGLALGYSTAYALTDLGNADVGGSQPARVYFDGDPFALDNGQPDGEPTLHDRSLAMVRVSMVNVLRMHRDPASGYLVDQVTMAGSTPNRGATASTVDAAYAILTLRASMRALSSQLELYSNNTPDRAIGTAMLDTLPLNLGTASSATFSQGLRAQLVSEAELLFDHLTSADGRAAPGWDVSKGVPTGGTDTLDAHTAAVRGLFAAYLATGDTRYRDRAMAVFNRIETVFYDEDARLYSDAPAPADHVTYTPLRFALLQSTLRDVYELVGSRAGGEALALDVESRIGRLNKLVLNGWDDRNQDRQVDWPEECVNVPDGGVPSGGLQMAERTLTGELGSLDEKTVHIKRMETVDREHDCVSEIDDAHVSAGLAGSITFDLTREAP